MQSSSRVGAGWVPGRGVSPVTEVLMRLPRPPPPPPHHFGFGLLSVSLYLSNLE